MSRPRLGSPLYLPSRKESFRLVLYNLQSSTSADVEFEGDVSGEPKAT